MRADVILCGVGGQGVLSAASVLAEAGLRSGLEVRQGEIHGMAQRGGAVQASLRLADTPIASDLVPRGTARLLLSLEPLEALRYLDYLGHDGHVVSAAEPVENIPDYPEPGTVVARLREHPRALVLPARTLAREAGSAHAANVVLLGAAAHLLPLEAEVILEVVTDGFREKGDRVVEANRKAFRAGEEAVATV